MKEFTLKPVIKYGECSLEYIKDFKKKRAFIVTDKMMVKLGLVNRIESLFSEEGSEYRTFDSVEPNPTVETVEIGLHEMVEFKPDIIIAVGGGSPIDACKAILYFYQKLKEKLKNKGFSVITEKPIFLAIPTTSGTGSEVTSYSVITDGNKKIALSHMEMLPDMAILNPDFTKTVPRNVVADTGMDVLTHAIEAFVSKESNPFTDAMAIQGIELIYKYLYKHYKNVEDYEPREKVQIASCLAGIAFNNSSLGINHSIAHSVGGKFKIAHGKANAIILAYVVEENMKVIPEKYWEIARKIGLPSNNLKEGCQAFLVFIDELRKVLGIQQNLKELGIDKEEFEKYLPEIIEDIEKDICTKSSPKQLSKSEFEKLLWKIYG